MDERSFDRSGETEALHEKCEINYSKASCLPQTTAALTAALGSVAMGLNLGWSSLVQLQLVSNATDFVPPSGFLVVNAEDWTWVASLLTLGALLGGLLGGPIIDLIGRKAGLLLTTLPSLIGWILISTASSPFMLYAGRILNGIAGGISSVATPTYIVEISTPNIRGRLGVLYHMTIVIGIWICNAVGLKLDNRSSEDWRWISLICASASLCMAIALIFVPESPYWLLRKGNRLKAAKAMRWSRGPKYDIESELTLLETSIQIQNSPTGRLFDLFGWWALKPFIVALGVIFFHQMCGINFILFYMAGIFEAAASDLPPIFSSFICNSVRVLVTIIVVMLVDKVGRKILLLTSTMMTAAGMMSLGAYYYLEEHHDEMSESISWLPLVSMSVFIAGFAVGLGPLPWLITPEIIPRNVRGPANSIASSYNWSLSFLVTKTFVHLQSSLTIAGTYWLLGGLCLLGVVFTAIFLPETKGKTYDEIQTFFGNSERPKILP